MTRKSLSNVFASKPRSSQLARSSRREISGFTMVELVIVIVIFGILAAGMLATVPSYFVKRRDDQRKADLHNMKFAFEDYVNDKNCYPPANIVQSCGSVALDPYMRKIPCDPKTSSAYTYVLSADCQSFQIYTSLEDTQDADVAALSCQAGCGPGKAYNYGVVGGNALFDR
ncbi:MAG: type II secretion system protein [Patescibacteria group bacterium]